MTIKEEFINRLYVILTPDEIKLIQNKPIEQAMKELAYVDYQWYLKYIYGDLYAHVRHTRYLCDKLEQVEQGEVKRLMVFMPPRHSKSMTITETFPSWVLGRNPNKQIIVACYGDDLAKRSGRNNRNILREYGEHIFGVTIANDSSAVENWNLQGYRGGMVATGIGGAITGKGADLMIIDDPVKNAEEANSETYRRKIKDEYRATLRTRLQPDGAIIIVQTRWHEDDLSGWLLEEAKNGGEQWEIINFPAFAEEKDVLGRKPGDILWPERFTVDDYKSAERALGSYFFAALYQQRPQPSEGNKFKRQWFRYFEEKDNYYILHAPEGDKKYLKDKCWVFQTADTASSTKTEADYTVISTWIVTPDKALLLDDVFREQIEVPDQEKAFVNLYQSKRPRFQGIETKNAGIALKQTLTRKGLPIKELKADTDKLTRATTIMVLYENGKVYHRMGGHWLSAYEEELVTFPNGKHDDQVDTASYAGMQITDYDPFYDFLKLEYEKSKQNKNSNPFPETR